MKDKFFMDTNILVYSFDTNAPLKQQKARELIALALNSQRGVISFQVIQEFLNVATRKFEVPFTIQETEIYLDQVLIPLCQAFPSAELYRKGLYVMERWQYSFYDSLIITSALQTGCKILYSEDLQHEQVIETLTIDNPFKHNLNS